MIHCLFVLIPNYVSILCAIAIAGGLYFSFLGFHLRARRRALLATPRCTIVNASPGPVEVNGTAAGPHTLPAPITGKPCFLYHSAAWQQSDANGRWEKIADEILHVPFYVDDASGQLLIEPLGADIDLLCDYREEYEGSSFSSRAADIPARIPAFLARHGIVPSRRMRIEEHSIKPGDAIFVAGMLAENPGVQVRPLALHSGSMIAVAGENGSSTRPEQATAPQIIRLAAGAAASSSRQMTQQEKIAAALARAGITKPEAWSAAGLAQAPVLVAEDTRNFDPRSADRSRDPRPSDLRIQEVRVRESQPDRETCPAFNLAPPVVLMKGAKDASFVISFRSQKEFALALAGKSTLMLSAGAAVTLLGVYVLLAQI
ncbi:MAG: hypothetical protein WAK29_04700 [Terriglobales bacterium]